MFQASEQTNEPQIRKIGLAALEQQNGYLAQVEVNEVSSLVRHV